MSDFTQNTGREFGWDDEIQNDGPEWVMLPEGDYEFIVTKFERQRHPGSAKLPPCPMAVLSLNIDGREKGIASITHRLYLHTNTEGLLCAFFECIGQRKHGEPLRMDWNRVIGATGWCNLEIHEYQKRDGSGEGRSNQIKRFLPPPEPKAAPGGGWTQGSF